jgi:hypothetical protein
MSRIYNDITETIGNPPWRNSSPMNLPTSRERGRDWKH